MLGEFNGLQALILKENESAHYIHCFAHQLQLALVDVAKKVDQIDDLFASGNGFGFFNFRGDDHGHHVHHSTHRSDSSSGFGADGI